MSYALTPADLDVLRTFAAVEGRCWKARLRRLWRKPPSGIQDVEVQALLRLRDRWGVLGLERHRLVYYERAKQLVPLLIHEDVRRQVLVDLGNQVDFRRRELRSDLVRLARWRAEDLGYAPGPDLDRGQMMWIRCYLHLADALWEPAVL